MAKLLSEQNVLKKLGIEDFRHLTKSKVIKLATMLDRMDPEVAKKALEQFPDFSNTAKEMILEYQKSLHDAYMSNDKSVQAVYDSYNLILTSLQNELKREELSFDEKKYIVEQMKIVADRIDKKDSENKRFLAGMAALATTTVLGVVVALASALGGNTDIKTIDSDPDIDA